MTPIKNIFLILSFIVSVSALADKNTEFKPLHTIDTSHVRIYDETIYASCILKNTNTSQGVALFAIRSACETMAIPKVCRTAIGEESVKCFNKCKSAGFFSKNFGECSY